MTVKGKVVCISDDPFSLRDSVILIKTFSLKFLSVDCDTHSELAQFDYGCIVLDSVVEDCMSFGQNVDVATESFPKSIGMSLVRYKNSDSETYLTFMVK